MIETNILKFKAEGSEFAKFLWSLEQFFGNRKLSLTFSWRFLRSKSEKIIRIYKHAGKVRKWEMFKYNFITSLSHVQGAMCLICKRFIKGKESKKKEQVFSKSFWLLPLDVQPSVKLQNWRTFKESAKILRINRKVGCKVFQPATH